MKIQEQTIYLDVLKSVFENRKKRSLSYSLRAYARDLKISPSNLSEIFNSKKNISDKMAQNIALRLDLRGIEKDLFLTSVLACRTKKTVLKENFELKLKKLLKTAKTKVVQSKELEQVNSWIHFAIMELMTFQDFDHSVTWLAQKLGMGEPQIAQHLETLKTLHWISEKNSEFTVNFDYSESSNDVPSSAIRKYHQSVLKKAAQEIEIQDVDEREFQSVVMGFDKAKAPQAKQAIRAFLDQFCVQFAHEEGTDKNKVYQLAIQFFNLTTEGKQ